MACRVSEKAPEMTRGESRLPDEPLGTAVVRGARLEHTERAPLEIVQRLF